MPNPIIHNLEVNVSCKKLSKICLQAEVNFDKTVCWNDQSRPNNLL